jgi:hypothetical protein
MNKMSQEIIIKCDKCKKKLSENDKYCRYGGTIKSYNSHNTDLHIDLCGICIKQLINWLKE